MVTLAIVLAAAVLMTGSRLSSSLAAYAVLTLATLSLAYDPRADVAHAALFACIGAVKVIAGPAAVLFLARRYGLPQTLTPSVNLAWRITLVAAAAVAGYKAGGMPAFSAVPHAGIVCYALFASIASIVLHRNLLAHVIGMLAVGSTIGLAGAVFAPGLPGSVEIADTFDVVIATFVAVLIARALVAYDPHLDVRSLRELRG